MNQAEIEQLVTAARSVRENAYAPYSSFCVGAALLCADGEVITGCNVENASLGLSLCAERTALTSAISRGRNQFKAILIAAVPLASPCGACRQFMSEFADDDFIILSVDANDSTIQRRWRMVDLLPNGFQLKK